MTTYTVRKLPFIPHIAKKNAINQANFYVYQ